MKVLYLTKYTRMAGSSRMRSYQYFPYLEKEGMKVSVKPFFDEAYLRDFYAGKKNIGAVIKSYLHRFFVLFTVLRYDRVVIEKEIFPFLPAFAEWMMENLDIKYIVDYDDAIFHNYDLSTNPIIRKFLGAKIAKVMRYSGTVVAGNSYLAEYARKAGAKNIEIIPTVIDLDRYTPLPTSGLGNGNAFKVNKENSVTTSVGHPTEGADISPFRAGEKIAAPSSEVQPENSSLDQNKFVIGWIGTKTTFEKHLLPCKEWIKALQDQDSEIQFNIVGITDDMDLGKNVNYIQWSEKTEVSEILKMDVGIMPLQDSEWEKGKCAYKLIQYAACGIPGMASEVGMNKEVCIDSETGYIANNEEDWKEKILSLKNDPGNRLRMGANARSLVEEKYCIQVTSKKWIKLLRS